LLLFLWRYLSPADGFQPLANHPKRSFSSSSSSASSRWHATLEKPGSSSSSDAAATASSTPPEQQQQQQERLPGSARLDTPWEELGFEFRPTRSHLKIVWRDDKWHEPTLVEGEPYLRLHIGATALHYGQSCFEGLKAFCHADSTVHLFCPEENARRMQSSCRRTLMAELPTDLFVDACKKVVRDNIEYVPPYGSNGALYIRPLLFGSGPRIGLQPADEYTFLCMVIPVGDYYKGGLSNPVKGRLITDYDRAAPRGVVRSQEENLLSSYLFFLVLGFVFSPFVLVLFTPLISRMMEHALRGRFCLFRFFVFCQRLSRAT
jgi:hypothetical protein